jgi:hypothetical protein
VARTKISLAANQLSDAGFLFIHDVGDIWNEAFRLRPSLAGEEALEMLENIEESERAIKSSAGVRS